MSIEEIKSKILPILKKYGISRASIFGSVVTGEAREDSDEDIVKYIVLIEKFISGMDKEKFGQDVKTQYSVIRGIEVIGEATKNLPVDFKDKYPDIPWKDIAGMRDKLIHAYFGVSLEKVWLVAKKDLPELRLKISNILREIEKE